MKNFEHVMEINKQLIDLCQPGDWWVCLKMKEGGEIIGHVRETATRRVDDQWIGDVLLVDDREVTFVNYDDIESVGYVQSSS